MNFWAFWISGCDYKSSVAQTLRIVCVRNSEANPELRCACYNKSGLKWFQVAHAVIKKNSLL